MTTVSLPDDLVAYIDQYRDTEYGRLTRTQIIIYMIKEFSKSREKVVE